MIESIIAWLMLSGMPYEIAMLVLMVLAFVTFPWGIILVMMASICI